MSDSAFHKHAAQLRTLIEAALREELQQADWPVSLRTAVEYSLMAGGKRLRPLLVLLACEACGGQVAQALPAACAIEMIHTYSLIHDDLPSMDDDDYRRGRLTSHKQFGEALAILAGDCLLTQAFLTVAAPASGMAGGSGRLPFAATELVRVLAHAAGGAGMVGGQVLDLEAERGPFLKDTTESDSSTRFSGCNGSIPSDLPGRLGAADSAGLSGVGVNSETIPRISSENSPNPNGPDRVEELSRIHRMKTGALIVASLDMGALCAGADSVHRERLKRYGQCIGLAFQIADDLLDVTGDRDRLGKSTGKDADLGKLTYPGLIGTEASRSRALQLVGEACACLEILDVRGRWLRELAEFIVERDH